MSPHFHSTLPGPCLSATRVRLGLVLATAGLCLSLATASALGSQDTSAKPTAMAADTTAKSDDAPAIDQEELDQMLAGIALYPDELLSQVLMASTYPLEIVEADRWASANKKLKGDALTEALEKQEWDPSVKSLLNFPDVLASLSENLTWTQKIGDAFLADQKSVLDTVQRLRHKAKDAGNLESSEQMIVTTEAVKDEGEAAATDAAAPAAEKEIEVIVIKSADPQVIYVPAYNPVVVYGTWWYPAYPPPVYYHPPYYHSGVAIAFGVGIVYGMAWGYAWGGMHWGHHNVNVNINRNVHINANINRNRYKTQGGGGRGSSGAWKHNPEHRKGVQYRDTATANKFGGKSSAQAQRSRDSFRGRAERDRSQLSKDRASGRIDSSGRTKNSGRASDRSRPTTRPSDRSGGRPSTKDRSAGTKGARPKGTNRSSGSSGAFGNSSRGRSASRDSARGSTSRGGASRGRSSAGGSRGGRGRGRR